MKLVLTADEVRCLVLEGLEKRGLCPQRDSIWLSHNGADDDTDQDDYGYTCEVQIEPKVS